MHWDVQLNAAKGFYRIVGVDQFDAGLFRTSGAEAAAMDAQQRLLLEVSHEIISASQQREPKAKVIR